MPNRDSVPEYQGMLERPRVHSLIQQGLNHPLLVVLAAPGYGKTQSIASYLSKSDAKVLWLRLNKMDNLQAHFWARLLHAMDTVFPDLAAKLREMGFPVTPPEWEAFLQLLRGEFSQYGQVVWVFDDFGEITDHNIKIFMRLLADESGEYLRIILISNVFDSTESVAFLAHRQALVLGKDLRFTKDEIDELYRLYQVVLSEDELNEIESYTEGWPLPLHLLLLYREKAQERGSYPDSLTHHDIAHMFEERFFAVYPQSQQKLLIKLSLLESFTWEFAAGLCEENPEDLEALANHVFVKNEPGTDYFALHKLYRSFLQRKQHQIDKEEQLAFWRAAARYYTEVGNASEAIACYRKCGDHIGMLQVIASAAVSQYGITYENASFFLEHLDLLTPEEVEEYPIADGIRALIYMSIYQLDKADAVLADMEQRLLVKDTGGLLGELYVMQGLARWMRGKEDFGDYFKKAVDYLPDEPSTKNQNELRLHNNHCFLMADNRHGAKERMERAIHYGIYWGSKAMKGIMSGMDHLFSAEAAYLSYQLSDSQRHAYHAIYKAQAHGQHDIVSNAYIVLARIAYLEGDFAGMAGNIQKLREYVDAQKIVALREIRDTALTWYYTKLHDYRQVPRSILTMVDTSQPILTLGRVQIVYANYMVNMGEYAKLVGFLEQHPDLTFAMGITQDSIYLHIILAISYHNLGKPDEAVKALWAAYDKTYENGLITPFIEAEDHMRALLELARRQQTCAFDAEWLDLVGREAASFSKRAKALRAVYKKQNPETGAIDNPLTKRELEVLEALAQGQTREEIAGKQYISVNTVKTFIRSIYNKLNASNRAEAVSIAISCGYIDAYIPEPL